MTKRGRAPRRAPGADATGGPRGGGAFAVTSTSGPRGLGGSRDPPSDIAHARIRRREPNNLNQSRTIKGSPWWDCDLTSSASRDARPNTHRDELAPPHHEQFSARRLGGYQLVGNEN